MLLHIKHPTTLLHLYPLYLIYNVVGGFGKNSDTFAVVSDRGLFDFLIPACHAPETPEYGLETGV